MSEAGKKQTEGENTINETTISENRALSGVPVMEREVTALLEEISSCPETAAVAVGGSRATGKADKKSDYDIYVYVEMEIAKERRKSILEKYCGVMEIGNHYWESEDNCTLNNGVDIDIIYRKLQDFEGDVAAVVEQNRASNGYTTCMWHNLATCRILYDREGALEAMKKRFDVPYPEALRAEIIRKNRALLSGVLPSYDAQIRKAASRRDLVSINHRTTEFLASYFDILFAMNRQTHPGEKRLVSLCKDRCENLPDRFEENLNHLFSVMYDPDGAVNDMIACMLTELDQALLKAENGQP